MPPPTTWSTSSVSSCRSLGVRHRSKLCAPSSSKSAPAFVRRLAAFAFTSPPAGRFKLCFATRHWPLTPANTGPLFSHPFSSAVLAEPCSKNKHASPSPRFLCPRCSTSLAITLNLKKQRQKTENLSSHELSRLAVVGVY